MIFLQISCRINLLYVSDVILKILKLMRNFHPPFQNHKPKIIIDLQVTKKMKYLRFGWLKTGRH